MGRLLSAPITQLLMRPGEGGNSPVEPGGSNPRRSPARASVQSNRCGSLVTRQSGHRRDKTCGASRSRTEELQGSIWSGVEKDRDHTPPLAAPLFAPGGIGAKNSGSAGGRPDIEVHKAQGAEGFLPGGTPAR